MKVKSKLIYDWPERALGVDFHPYPNTHAFKNGKDYVVFAGAATPGKDLDLTIHERPDNFSILVLQIIFSYGLPVPPMRYRHALRRYLACRPSDTVNDVADRLCTSAPWVLKTLKIRKDIDDRQAPLANLAALSKIKGEIPEQFITLSRYEPTVGFIHRVHEYLRAGK